MPKLTTLIGLEISKMFHKKRILFGTSFLLLIFVMMAYSTSKHTPHEFHESPGYREFLIQDIEFMKEELENANLDENQRASIEQHIAELEHELEVGYVKARETSMLKELESIEESLESDDLDESTVQALEARQKLLVAQLEYGVKSPEARELELKGRLSGLKMSLDNATSSQERMRTEMAIKETELLLEQTQLENDHNAFSLLIMFFISTGSFFLPLIIILVAAEAISGEYSLGTIKLLLINPFTRTKLYISKYIALLLYGLSVFVFISVVGYIIGGFFVGFGGASLTRIVGQVRLGSEYGYIMDYSSAFLVTNLQYLLILLGLITITLTVIIAFSMLISVFTKSATISLVATMGLIIFGSIISGMFHQQNWIKYLPMPHFDLLSHLNGHFWFDGVTLNFSITILLVYTIICLGLGLYSFKRKDIL